MHDQQPSSRLRGADRRRGAVGHHGAAVEAGAGLAGAGLARVRPVRGRRGRPAAGCGRGQGPGRRPAVLASGAVGYGGSVLLQYLGIGRTSLTHAALIMGATPVLIAVIAVVWQRTVAKPVAWA